MGAGEGGTLPVFSQYNPKWVGFVVNLVDVQREVSLPPLPQYPNLLAENAEISEIQ